MRLQLLLQNAAGLDEQAPINRLVRHPIVLVMRIRVSILNAHLVMQALKGRAPLRQWLINVSLQWVRSWGSNWQNFAMVGLHRHLSLGRIASRLPMRLYC